MDYLLINLLDQASLYSHQTKLIGLVLSFLIFLCDEILYGFIIYNVHMYKVLLKTIEHTQLDVNVTATNNKN